MVIVAALVIATIAWTQAVRGQPRPDEGERAAIEKAATTALTLLMTFGGPDAADPAQVRSHMTEPLLSRYAADGSNVVLPGSVGTPIRMSVTVVGTAISAYAAERARVLAFIDQRVSGSQPTSPQPPSGDPDGTADNDDHTPSESWLVMSKVNGTWLLADLQPVGDITR